MFISAGASVPGVFWKTIFTPSTVISSMSSSMMTVRRDQAEVAGGGVLADGLIDVTERAGRQQHAVLVEQPPVHGVAGVDVLRHGVIHEANRGDDLDLAAAHVGLVHHAAHAAEVIGVGVRVDHRDHGALAELLVDELERRRGGLLRGQRIEHDPAGVALDEADVGQIEAAHLVDRRV